MNREDDGDGEGAVRRGERVPDPSEIFARAADEGERRLNQSLVELAATSFIAGYTVVFGIVAFGIVHAMIEPQFGDLARVAGALAFGIGLVFLVIGRAELFNENFFDPTVAAIERSESRRASGLLRLWTVTFVLNLVGGIAFAYVLSVDGALPSGTAEALGTVAEEIAGRESRGILASAIAGGALVTLLSYLLASVESAGGRITLSYLVGFLLALGPFDHVVVTVLHLIFGVLFGAPIDLGTVGTVAAVSTAGNLVGGLGLGTLTHVVQAKGARDGG